MLYQTFVISEGVLLKNFAKIHRKIPVLGSRFNNVTGLHAVRLATIKKRLWHRSYPVKFA